MSVQYRHADEPDRDLLVDSDGDGVVILASTYGTGSGASSVTVDLGRDAVAALVGQLQSWLKRTEGE